MSKNADAYLAFLLNSMKEDIDLKENPEIVELISKHVQSTLGDYLKVYDNEQGHMVEKKKTSGGRNSYHGYLAQKKDELGEAYDHNRATIEYKQLNAEERKQYAPEKTDVVTVMKKTTKPSSSKWREFCAEWSQKYKSDNGVEKLPQNWMTLAAVDYKQQKDID